ncbi:MAG: FkbM family methyltransferase [Pseudomonadota bacterium]
MKPKLRTLRQRIHNLLNSKTVVLDGVRLNAQASLVGTDVRTEMIRGSYEFAERKLLLSCLQPGDRVVEIGAGVGAIGLVAANAVGAANVVSYEANPDLELVIRGNHKLNNLAPKLVMKAVTVAGGSVDFYVAKSLLSSSLHSRGEHTVRTVESEAFDLIIAEESPSVLVLDVEGAEVELLKNAKLEGIRALLIEMHPNVVGEEAIEGLEAYLKSVGFSKVQTLHRNMLLERRGMCG